MPASAPSAPISCSPAAPSSTLFAAPSPAERLRVADRGLREGMLVQMMREDGVVGRARRGRRDARAAAGATSRSGSRRASVRCPRSSGWSGSSTIPTSRAPSGKVFARRAAFKLIEIDDKHHLLKKGGRVVDLGAAPGGWSQVAAKRIGAEEGRGKIVAIDLLPMAPLPGVEFIELDFLDPRRTGSDQEPARRSGRCRPFRHGGERYRPPSDRPSQDHGAGGGRGRFRARGALSPAARFSARCCRAAPRRRCLPRSSAISPA